LTRKLQLYDLKNDPSEKENIFKENAPTSDLIFNKLRQFMKFERTAQPLGKFSPEEINKLRGLGYLH